ncbi:MAG: glycosyltransferase family 2 protein [Candidatus Electrothrix sp. AW5]|nr:glycosyltransferase family 2 protein [Candidatus Electrothrix gigas]
MNRIPKIFILLPVHNRRKITERFIKCLVYQTWNNYHLILIDDGSFDDTKGMVLNYLPGTTVIKGTGNWWWAGCLQRGIDWLHNHDVAPDDLVLFINDDVVISPDFLYQGATYLEHKKTTLLLAQVIDDATGNPVESGMVADLAMHKFIAAQKGDVINCFSTRGLLLKFGDILEIGGFYPKLLPHYGSDYEYTIRAFKKGFQLNTIPLFNLQIDNNETGLHHLSDSGLLESVKNIFSKKYVSNPIYRTTFIILISPIKRIPILIFPFWKNAFKIIFRKITTIVLSSGIKVKENFSSGWPFM